MRTPDYENINPAATQQLQLNFPFFYMFTFLIPLYYIVSKLSEEKESKSREGMKMMGLSDSTYFLSWFIFYAIVVLVMSIIITIIVSINVFNQSNKGLIFILCFLYGLSLFGFSVLVVAFIPTQRSSATVATLFHLISYFIVFTINDPQIPVAAKFILSLFPNIAATLSLYNLFHFELQGTGLSAAASN